MHSCSYNKWTLVGIYFLYIYISLNLKLVTIFFKLLDRLVFCILAVSLFDKTEFQSLMRIKLSVLVTRCLVNSLLKKASLSFSLCFPEGAYTFTKYNLTLKMVIWAVHILEVGWRYTRPTDVGSHLSSRINVPPLFGWIL